MLNMSIVKIVVPHFINSKKCTKYQLIVSKFFSNLTMKSIFLMSINLLE